MSRPAASGSGGGVSAIFSFFAFSRAAAFALAMVSRRALEDLDGAVLLGEAALDESCDDESIFPGFATRFFAGVTAFLAGEDEELVFAS